MRDDNACFLKKVCKLTKHPHTWGYSCLCNLSSGLCMYGRVFCQSHGPRVLAVICTLHLRDGDSQSHSRVSLPVSLPFAYLEWYIYFLISFQFRLNLTSMKISVK